jgi:hypothetical protein
VAHLRTFSQFAKALDVGKFYLYGEIPGQVGQMEIKQQNIRREKECLTSRDCSGSGIPTDVSSHWQLDSFEQ